MPLLSARSVQILITAAMLASISSCGEKQGNDVGKDPNIPVSLKPQNPETNSPNSPQNPSSVGEPNTSTGGTGNNPSNSAGDGSTTPPTVPVTPPAGPTGATLTVGINGIREPRGNVCLSLFNSPDGFPDSADKAILAECFTVAGKSFEIKIENVPSGTYAIALWHDENRDGKMNYNFLGIPKEGVAFSENGRPRITPPPPGPPSFSAISFAMGTEPRTTQTKMTYLLDFL